MKVKNISLIAILAFSFLLVGCSTNDDLDKQDFFVDVLSSNKFGDKVFITKPGKVIGSQNIVVSSQVAGRVKSIDKKDGDTISGDQIVISISDSIANYGLQLQRAKNALGRANLQKEQTKISLDKSLSDVSTALDIAKNNYDVGKLTTEQSLKKAELDFSSATAQADTIYLQFDLEKNNSINVLDTILSQMDTYLGVTDEYKNINIHYEPYLGGNMVSSKETAKKYVTDLYDLRRKINELPSNTQDAKVVVSGAALIEQGYNKAYQLLDAMKTVLNNSIVTNVLTQQMIDGYRARVDGLLSSLQGAKTSLSAYRRQTNSLLSKGSSGFVDVTKSQAQIGYDMARINSHNTTFNTEMGLKSAEVGYDTLLKNNNIQIGMANSTVSDANIAYEDALSKFNNLWARAPIPGVIGTILVDVGQEIAPGTPLFSMSNKDQQTIEVYVTDEERGYLSLEQSVKITYGGMDFTGYILSVSSIAEKNTLYKVTVGFNDSVSILGGVANVQLPISLPFTVLPINVITPVSENRAFISIYSGDDIQKSIVILGRVWDSYVEILSGLNQNMNIIINDVSYFDPSKFKLKIKE